MVSAGNQCLQTGCSLVTKCWPNRRTFSLPTTLCWSICFSFQRTQPCSVTVRCGFWCWMRFTLTRAHKRLKSPSLCKLRRRLNLSPESIRCIGTSASFASGEKVDAEVLQFASNLFGAPFTKIIRGKRQEHRLLRDSTPKAFKLKPATWIALGQLVSKIADDEAPEPWCAGM